MRSEWAEGDPVPNFPNRRASLSFHCNCGFTYEGDDFDALDHQPDDGNCCNCGGRKCMVDCVLRYMHDQCEDDCPDCCP